MQSREADLCDQTLSAVTQTVCGESALKPKLLLLLSVTLPVCVSFSRLHLSLLKFKITAAASHQTRLSATGPDRPATRAFRRAMVQFHSPLHPKCCQQLLNLLLVGIFFFNL